MRIARILVTAAGACALASPVQAQHDHDDSPYAGMEHSEIPALTEQEIDDLRSGAGMGFARAAELNHYPGPKHVLELAEAISLTEEQRERILEIQSEMREAAIELGEAIIGAERDLNIRFRHGHIDDESLSAATREIAVLYGELRSIHLRAHLATRAVLEEEQVAEYDRQRGYAQEQETQW
jgi:hypothetical protein